LRVIRIILLIFFALSAGFSHAQSFFYHFTSKHDSIQSEKYYLIKISDNLPKIWSKRVSADTLILRGSQIDASSKDQIIGVLVNSTWKISAAAIYNGQKNPQNKNSWQVSTVDFEQTKAYFTSQGIQITDQNQSLGIIEVFTSFEKVQQMANDHSAIQFIGEKRIAQPESLVRKHDFSVNGIYKAISAHGKFGSPVGIKEQSFNINDIDLKSIGFSTPWTDPGVSAHATDMATLVAGKGVLYTSSEGVSSSLLYSTSFNNLMPDPSAFYIDYGITVQNHSYGVGIENFYGPEAAAFDSLALKFNSLITVFSSGNQGESAGDHGDYVGINGFATLTGEFKQSKNSLIIGAIDSVNQTQFFSSTGPAYDGRIKPELVAFGGEGSSDAAAVVSGAISYLQGAVLAGEFGVVENYLPNTVVKSVLIATADELGEPGPDFITGYGNLNLDKAFQTLKNSENQVFDVTFHSNLNEITIPIKFNTDVANVRIALAWNDLPAQPNDASALIANLDIRLYNPVTGLFHYPWVLNTYPNADSLRLPAKRGIDDINVVELISIDQLTGGDYLIEINYKNKVAINGFVPQAHVAIAFDTIDFFEWAYPFKDRPLIANTQTIVRWSHSFTQETGKLYKRLGNGAWEEITNAVPLAQGFISLMIPDTAALAQFRMDIAGQSFLSEIFGITPAPDLRLHVNCSDSLIFKWNKIVGINQYWVIPEGDFDSRILVTDTVLSIAKSNLLTNYFAVVPLFENIQVGNRSYAINYNLKGTGCYLDNFLVSKGQINQVNLDVRLSGISEILNAEILKIYGNEVNVFESFVPRQAQYSFQDYEVKEGITKYQLILTLNDQVIESEQFEIALARSKSILFPNPIEKGSILSIINAVPGAVFQLIDNKGQPVLETAFVNDVELLPLLSVRPGLYTYRVLVGKQLQDTGKLIIQ